MAVAKVKTTYVCQNCGAVSPRWQGKCDDCGEWNSMVEETGAGVAAGPVKSNRKGRVLSFSTLAGETPEAPRIVSGVGEFDRVTGGGIVRGSALLVGGDPGIGKSTLLLQTAGALARQGHRVVYISGEEAIGQIRLRASRLGVTDAPVLLAAETSVEDIIATLESGPAPALVIADSIQTLWTGMADSAPGTVTQVRASAQALIRYAKQSGAAVIFVGHVTKEGQIAGPRVVEHMVDGVLYFEGEGGHHFRILRAVKNRFGATDEIGVFEMTGAGLGEVLAAGATRLLNWRHNLGQGAAVTLLEPGAEGAAAGLELAERAAGALNLAYGSVDVVETARGPLVMEVNAGLMMEFLARSVEGGEALARRVYRRAFEMMLE